MMEYLSNAHTHTLNNLSLFPPQVILIEFLPKIPIFRPD